MAPPRALRIGVLLGGNLVEERVLTDLRKPITLGQSLRCSLSLPLETLPAEHVLFTWDQNTALLHVIPGTSGRIAQGGTIATTLPETVAIAHGARGKLCLGEATILFQEIAAPPLAPRPQLPASIRGSLADRVDRRLALIVGGSLLAHIGIAAWAWATDRDTGSMLSRLVEYHQETIDVSLPDLTLDLTPTNPDEPGAATPVAPVQTPAPIVRPRALRHAPTPSDPSRLQDDADRMAAILTGTDAGEHGPGEMRPRHPGADLDKQLDDVRGRHITIGDGRPTSRGLPGFHLGTDHGPNIDDPSLITGPAHRSEDPGTVITLRPVPTHEAGTTLSVELVLAKISGAYMAGLQRCYKQGLAHDGSLAGKVSLSFTVSETGRISDSHASGVSGEVDACIGGQMGAWRFPIPKDKDGDPTDASFGVILALQPS